jgi:Fur family ferric uptake transcriptional regulator
LQRNKKVKRECRRIIHRQVVVCRKNINFTVLAKKQIVKRRNTPAKQEILKILSDNHTALSQDMIEEKLTIPADRVTIYRILNSFCKDGITHKVVAEDGKSYFALCNTCSTHNHHHDHFHFKCSVCNNIECLKQTIDISLPKGYSVTDMNCIVNGICAKCA